MYRKVTMDKFFRKKVRKLLNRGQFKIGPSGRLEPTSPKGSLATPWVFTNFDARRKFCNHWNSIYCGEFDLIPRFCRFNCWKTVIYPRNVYETFLLHDVLRSLNLPSKCGADRRNYTYRKMQNGTVCGAWGGYIYGDTLEQGREYYTQIRKAVDEIISPDIDIILKRGCTEMERLKPSDTWDDYTDGDKALELQLDDVFHFEELTFNQAAWTVRDVKEGWILRAIEMADPTVEQTLTAYGEGVTLADLTVKSITYHNDDPRVKKENDNGEHNETG